MDSDILVQVTAATTVAKVGVDFIKKSAFPTPSWLLPILALLIGEGAAFLLLLHSGAVLTLISASGAVLAGFLAACAAVGATELQKSADTQQRKDEKIAEAERKEEGEADK